MQVLSRLDEDPGVFLEQTQEFIFLFGRKMFPDQEISIRIVVITEVAHIPGNEEGNHEEKNTDQAPAFHLQYLFGGFNPETLCTAHPFFAFRLV
jgi:hypothetical protein